MGFEQAALAKGVWGVEVFLVLGTGVLVVLLGRFVVGEKYRREPRGLCPVEFARAREEAEALVEALAPVMISLAERERAVGSTVEEVSCGEVWERFAAASARTGEEPTLAVEELRRLSEDLDGCFRRLAEGVSRVGTSSGKERGDGSA